jgi:two-component system, OmpR family, response regulator RegX3
LVQSAHAGLPVERSLTVPKILLIEDEEGLGEALEYQLEREGYAVERYTDGAVGLERFNAAGADLVLLDLMLPGMSGEEICREIRRRSGLPIIMLTARDTEIDKVVGLELGADDYVTKPFSTRELLARIRAVLRRAVAAPRSSDGAREGGGIRLDSERFEVTVDGQLVHMPRKEFELLELLMREAGSVVSRERLIDEVWDVNWFGSTKTLDVHVSGLRRKLGDNADSPRFIHTVRGVGFRFSGPEEL